MKHNNILQPLVQHGRSLMGAWIETCIICKQHFLVYVAPLWERGLKHFPELPALSGFSVAPLWERGLKLDVPPFLVGAGESLPYGSVD